MRTTALILSLMLVAPKIQAEPELKGTPTELAAYLAALPRIVSVTGESQVTAEADHALVHLRIMTENKSWQEAVRLNEEARSKLVLSLKERGVRMDQIEFPRFPFVDKRGPSAEKQKNHQVETIVVVRITDRKGLETVAGVVDNLSAVSLLGMESGVTNAEELRRRALSEALENATQKQQLYEQKLGARLIIKAISGGTVSPSQ